MFCSSKFQEDFNLNSVPSFFFLSNEPDVFHYSTSVSPPCWCQKSTEEKILLEEAVLGSYAAWNEQMVGLKL